MEKQVKQKFFMDMCQIDYPLDMYPSKIIPYAEEYLNLPDRKISTILQWMDKYMKPAIDHFGNNLLLLGHYYMGGEIIRFIEYYQGTIGDSYQLAMQGFMNPEKKIIVESAVHFMAETSSILSNKEQITYITNPKSGCTMEMEAKDYMVVPALRELNNHFGKKNILPICYMNTSGRIKALVGEQGGAVCTSSNVKKIFKWAMKHNKKIFFIPDQYMGENVAYWLNISNKNIAYWPSGNESLNINLETRSHQKYFNKNLILFASHCGVHSRFEPNMVKYWQRNGYSVIVHPECKLDVVSKSDICGSTALIWNHVINDLSGTKHYAIGTEHHMIENLKSAAKNLGIVVVSLSEDRDLYETSSFSKNCGCATMSRNDPPHLVGVLDLLRKGETLSEHIVKPGDVVNEITGIRERLSITDQEWVKRNALSSLIKMIEITEQN